MSNKNPNQAHSGESAPATSGSKGAPDFAGADKDNRASEKAEGLAKKVEDTLEHGDAQDADLIKDVWMSNFFSAMDHISKLVDQYNYISMVSISKFSNN